MTIRRRRLTAAQKAALAYKVSAPTGIGPTRATVLHRRERCEAEVQHRIRTQCVERDGDCRVATDRYRNGASAPRARANCSGWSEWAHFEDQKRARTVNMPPETRHTLEGSLMLCTGHHRAYDAGRLQIRALDPLKGCNGPLEFV